MKFRTASVAIAVVTAVSPLAVIAPAHATGPTSLVDFQTMPNTMANTVQWGFMSFKQTTGELPPAGTNVVVTVSSCGTVIKSGSTTFDGTYSGMQISFRADGEYNFFADANVERIGRQLNVSVAITDPAYGSYTNEYTVDAGVPRPSCEEIAQAQLPGGGRALVVNSWSEKIPLAGVGTDAVVGRYVKITRTASNGAESYRWTLGTKVISESRRVLMKPAYEGKALKVKIVASSGAQTKSKTLRYGRVAARTN